MQPLCLCRAIAHDGGYVDATSRSSSLRLSPTIDATIARSLAVKLRQISSSRSLLLHSQAPHMSGRGSDGRSLVLASNINLQIARKFAADKFSDAAANPQNKISVGPLYSTATVTNSDPSKAEKRTRDADRAQELAGGMWR